MMTDADVERYVAEVERRWRERTPATTIDAALPAFRVSRGEMRAWCIETLGKEIEMDDLAPIQKRLAPVYRRLRVEFPDEMW